MLGIFTGGQGKYSLEMPHDIFPQKPVLSLAFYHLFLLRRAGWLLTETQKGRENDLPQRMQWAD